MASIVENTFKYREVNFSKLIGFGFVKDGSSYIYRRVLTESGFVLNVTISAQGEVFTEVVDPSTDEIYTLHLVDGAVGSFIGLVRCEYEETLKEIANACFEPAVFKSSQTKQVIAYVRNKYGDELEFLWEKFPDCAVWRRKDTKKWYAVLLTVSKRKLGINSDEVVEVIDLRVEQEGINSVIDNKKYFPGYHMNKKHWVTVILDCSVPDGEIYRIIDQSYTLAV